MASDESLEEELRRDGEDPQLFFVLGSSEDGALCTFTPEGTIQSFFMSDEKAERLRKYLKARNRIFKTIAHAQAAFPRIKAP